MYIRKGQSRHLHRAEFHIRSAAMTSWTAIAIFWFTRKLNLIDKTLTVSSYPPCAAVNSASGVLDVTELSPSSAHQQITAWSASTTNTNTQNSLSTTTQRIWWRCSRSSSMHQLHVPPFRLSTVGRRSFPVAAAILWNTLPVDVQSSPSLPVFHQRLKTFLFHKSFPDVVWQADYAFVDLVMASCYFSHVNNFLIEWLISWQLM